MKQHFHKAGVTPGWTQTGVGMTSSKHGPDAIRIGVAANEPIRVAGLASIFDQPAQPGPGAARSRDWKPAELLALDDIEYIVVDLHSTLGGLEALETIRRERPDVRSIVIGPEGDDELVMSAIIAGARAYLGHSAGPELVRRAIDVVTSGSIWAPRRLALPRDRPPAEGSGCIASCFQSAAYKARASRFSN